MFPVWGAILYLWDTSLLVGFHCFTLLFPLLFLGYWSCCGTEVVPVVVGPKYGVGTELPRGGIGVAIWKQYGSGRDELADDSWQW